MAKNFDVQSRDGWHVEGAPSIDGLKLGCLQRIAASQERIAEQIAGLRRDMEQSRDCYCELRTWLGAKMRRYKDAANAIGKGHYSAYVAVMDRAARMAAAESNNIEVAKRTLSAVDWRTPWDGDGMTIAVSELMRERWIEIAERVGKCVKVRP